MTIIAAAIDRDRNAWAIGCDTGVSNSGAAWEVKTKIVRVGPALVGWAGNAGVARYLAEVVRRDGRTSIYKLTDHPRRPDRNYPEIVAALLAQAAQS